MSYLVDPVNGRCGRTRSRGFAANFGASAAAIDEVAERLTLNGRRSSANASAHHPRKRGAASGSDGRQPWRGSGRSEGYVVGDGVYQRDAEKGRLIGRPGDRRRDRQNGAGTDPQSRQSLALPGRQPHRPAHPPALGRRLLGGAIRTRLAAGGGSLLCGAATFRRRGWRVSSIAQFDRVPTSVGRCLRGGRLLGVGRRLDMMGGVPRPSAAGA